MNDVGCLFCRANYGRSVKAIALAPQFFQDPKGKKVIEWVPVCKTHKSGWWEGSDIPRSKRSAFRKIGPCEELIVDATDTIRMIDDFLKGNASKDDLFTVMTNLEERVGLIEKGWK